MSSIGDSTHHSRVPPKARKAPRDPHLKKVGDRIREIRSQRVMSQEEVAHRVGVDRTYQSDVERGMRNFGILLVFDYAKVLKVKPEDLLK
jgi:DNA-binding XRE family transcriptional regulator